MTLPPGCHPRGLTQVTDELTYDYYRAERQLAAALSDYADQDVLTADERKRIIRKIKVRDQAWKAASNGRIRRSS
jgi:hypothetical protein